MVWYCDKNRNTDQWKRTERPEINLTHLGHLVLNKDERIYNGQQSFFNKWCWEDWTVICKRVNPDYFLTSFTKINSKWIKDLNLRLETIKLLEENIGSVHFDISLSNMFCICLLRQRETKAKINR